MHAGSALPRVKRLAPACSMTKKWRTQALLNSLLDHYMEGPTLQLTHKLTDLAVRELPPGTWSGIYLLYQAHCLSSKERPASRAVFYEAVRSWKRVLRFRRRSQHSICAVCDRLKSEMRHSNSFVSHAAATDKLLGHLATTWRCREVYWEARHNSRQPNSDCLCLIIDGYDKSKPCIPRWPAGRPPKGGAFDRVSRPGCQISAVLCHGHGCIVFMAEEQVSCGGSYQWDTLLIAINEVWNRCCSSGRRFPRTSLGAVLSFMCG